MINERLIDQKSIRHNIIQVYKHINCTYRHANDKLIIHFH